MNTPKFHEPNESYPSDLKLDQYLRGELSASERKVFERNVPAALQKRLAERRAERDAFPYEAPAFSKLLERAGKTPVETQSPSSFWRLFGGAAASLCAVALVVVVVGNGALQNIGEGPQVLSKGAFLNVYVKRGNKVLQTKALKPGDRLAFELTSPAERYGAVLSVDGAQKTSVYAPEGERMVKVQGTHRFDHSIELDATVGRERLVGFLCDKEFALDALKSWVSESAKLPAGCERTTIDAKKRK